MLPQTQSDDPAVIPLPLEPETFFSNEYLRNNFIIKLQGLFNQVNTKAASIKDVLEEIISAGMRMAARDSEIAEILVIFLIDEIGILDRASIARSHLPTLMQALDSIADNVKTEPKYYLAANRVRIDLRGKGK